jgi:hypothetical protein
VVAAVTVVACLQGVIKIQFLRDQEDLSGGVNSFLLLLREAKLQTGLEAEKCASDEMVS